MKLYLTPTPSLELIRYLRATNGEDGLGGTSLRKRSLADAINTTRALDELDVVAQRWIEHAGVPVHAFVNDRSKGTTTKRLVTHVHSGYTPNGAMIDLGHDVCICAPHFAFTQIAAEVDLVDAVRIGMELCGTYSRWILDPNDGNRQHESGRDLISNRGCTFKLPAAMRLSRARAFVERQSHYRGIRAAHSALKWVLDGSASPMETAVYLLLCLPKRLGGYGLPKPVLNPKLLVSNPDGTKERYPDLFFAGVNIDVEYNSDSEHSGEWCRYRDSKREVELTVANIKVLPLTRPQLMSTDEFDAFAQGLRRMLGVRSRATDLEWAFRRDELRRRLLASWL